ncbi:hypothetical protein C483_18955 [Natrialba hulunbeirensis JCM 10989]|uniref:Uncharacterized protein n=1 Tax=Natrialba hulunbeirensis JCM 10989 TaxID=1227493 RepID=L9ZJL8_9EURY|nr:hypothetical protein [Natrialba hulunbeirensis]ELY86519.1 hypothetical protein C483_18955 [Natrialba hulunbeirensis JCM 10989]
MKTLEVTDEQYEFIQRLREEISKDVVGRYGFVREQDALQFLLDNIDDEVANAIDLEAEFSATDDVAASVGAAIEGEADPHALEEITYDETGDVDGATDGVASDSDAESSLEESAGDSSDEADDEGASGTGDEAGDSDDDDTDDDNDTTSGEADDDDMLDEMMSLLETHDDKWEESSSADYRYTVTLPDGSTEDVQTKDDVRALLFKNYR